MKRKSPTARISEQIDNEKTPQLTLTNDVIFKAVMSRNQAALKMLLEGILNIHILKITMIRNEAEDSLNARRLVYDLLTDVLDENEKNVHIGVELTNYGNTRIIFNRSLHYFSHMFIDASPVGGQMKDFEKMSEVHQITICQSVDFLKDSKEMIHHFRWQSEKYIMEDHGIEILELAKAEALEEKPMADWNQIEEIAYYLQFSENRDKRDIIKLLEEKNEVLRSMSEDREKFLQNEYDRLSALKAAFIEADLREAEEAKDMLRETRSQLEETEERLNQAKTELTSTKNELDHSESQLSDVKSELSSAQNELGSVQSKLSSTQSELSSTKTELSSTKTELSSTKTELSSTKTELSDAKVELSILRMHLKGVSVKEIADLSGCTEEEVTSILNQ